MKKKVTNKQELLTILNSSADGISLKDISTAMSRNVSVRTVQRLLSELSAEGQVKITGSARSTRYLPVLAESNILREEPNIPYVTSDNLKTVIPISAAGKLAHLRISRPIQQREPAVYQKKFLKGYRPNVDSYLSNEQKRQLALIGNAGDALPAGTYAQQILNRLLIDLSWNSSRLEGNTYSLLDTERLIIQGEADDTKSAREAQMILNHKDAIEFLVQSAEGIDFNRYTFLNLHAMLAHNLVVDEGAPGRLRSMMVRITGSTYSPTAIPQLIEECFELILSKTKQINDPFEQAFFLMVHLPYLQAFDDVNKRVSRLAANIPLILQNLAPLSFVDVSGDLYLKAMIAIYEDNDVSLLRDVFMWAYARSAANYSVVRQTLGEPNLFKLKYRDTIRDLITAVIIRELDTRNAQKEIRLIAADISPEDREQFIYSVESEIRAIHEGNFARYKVSQAEFKNWQKIWKG